MSDNNIEIEELIEHLQDRSAGYFPIYPTEEVVLGEDDQIDWENLPLLPLRNVVVAPGQIVPIVAQREQSKRLIRWVEESSEFFGVVTQKNSEADKPTSKDLYRVGTLVRIEGLTESADGTLSIMVRGLFRIQIERIRKTSPFMVAIVTPREEQPYQGTKAEQIAVLNSLKDNFFESYSLISRPLPPPYIARIRHEDNLAFFINFALSATGVSVEKRQQILELDDVKSRAYEVLTCQQTELQILRLKAQINEKTKKEIDQHNKEYFLQHQLRSIQEELGAEENEIATFRKQAEGKGWTEHVMQAFERELKKAERMGTHTPDYSVQMQYLQTFLNLPWGIYTEDNFDLKRAERILDAHHYGLDKVKERILEHLSVLKLRGDMKSPIICLYGPPGVGKTSLGKSIAESLGRKYVRISLGGVHDEAEIRGHRRTYIGAMSGRIIQSLAKAESSNPVFVLDEIDKMGTSHHSDPSSALLEVLDPEQNTAFHDNYLDVDYDLSKVLFIATANDLSAISRPLRDRMEIIEISGYIEEEKHQIAKKYLIPKALYDHGLTDKGIKLSPRAIDTIIEEYTRESGVRGLDKRMAELMRKVAWLVARGDDYPKSITPDIAREYLGKPIFQRDKYQSNEHAGVVVGLAWTSVGGDILYVESSLQKGTEAKLTLTGSLGDVMKESAVLALSYIKGHYEELGIDPEILKDKSVHIHVPEGAVPKDGPSAGITIVTSLVSAMTRRKVKAHIAMTGEITLRGKVLPVGGIKEKILAAKRSGIKEIVMCRENEKDVLEIKTTYLKGLSFHYVEDISEVLEIALTNELAKR